MRIHIITLSLCFMLTTVAAMASNSGIADFVNMAPQGAQTVISVAQDADGMMWIGTESGLYSYDGYRFNAAFTQGERSNTRVHSILAHNETLYLGTDNGLMLYSLRTGRYSEPKNIKTGEMRTLCLTGQGVLCGAAAGLFRYDDSKGRLVKLSYPISNIYALLRHGRGLLVGSIGGLHVIKGRQCRLIPVKPEKQPLVNAMLSDGHGGAWIGTEGELYRMDKDLRMEAISALHGNSIKALTSLNGQLLAGTDNGLFTLNSHGQAAHSTHDSRDEGSIASNIVWALTTDQFGNLWAGTDNGLSMCAHSAENRTIRLSTLTGNGDGNCLYAILREADGTTWLGGSNGLIRHTPAQKGQWQGGKVAWFRQNNATTHLTHNRVRRIYKDRQGDILVCTDHGINLYDRGSGTFRNFIVHDPTGKYTTTWAYDIVQDARDRYWISSYMGGVFMIDKARLLASDGSVEADRHFMASLQSVHVGRIALDNRGKLWLQLYGNGLDRLDTHTFSITHVLKKQENEVSFVMADNHGDVWTAGPSEVRMFRADGRKGRTYRLQDSPARRITSMGAVGNSVWALTGHECMVFTSDGRSSRFAVPGSTAPLSVWHDTSSDAVLLGGNDAFTVLPSAIAEDTSAPRLMLSQITVNGKPWQPEGSAISSAGSIELAATQNNLTLSLTDTPYAGLRKGVYAYLLEGAGHSWQYLDDGALDITFNALPHGSYTLKVSEVDGQGHPAIPVFSLKIKVLPPWYLSWWAKIIYLAAITGLCVWGMNFYMMRKRLADERQARRSVMEQSEARAAFYSTLSRKLKAPLAKIMSQAGQMLHDETDTRQSIGIESIRKHSGEISRLVYEALDQTVAEPQTQDKACIHEPTDIVDFCRRTISDVRHEASAGKPDIDFRTDTPVIYIGVDLPGFYPPFYAFVRKAVALAGESGSAALSLSADAVHRTVEIRMEIPSHVIPNEKLPFVFYRYRSDNDGAANNGNMNELSALKDFAASAGGSFSVSSDNAHGTTFTLSLPCSTASAQQRPAGRSAQTAQQHDGKITATAPTQTPDMTDSKLLASITAAIEEHLSDSDFNVTKLASSIGMGDKSLYRRIKQMTGKTPVELIRHIRMQRASVLLREGRFSVSEVMYLVGYQNSSYFSKCFAKTYGITPAEYSKKASL